MVKVCDAIMGTGKSSAAITYMNEHPDKRYIYITPYVTEAQRIAQACKNIEMFEPKKTGEFHGSKTAHTFDMVKDGKSIATTHQAFRLYTEEMTEKIKEIGYTLIIDEDVDTLDDLDMYPSDVQMAIDAGYLKQKGYLENVYRFGDRDYKNGWFNKLFQISRVRDIIKQPYCEGEDSSASFFYWQLPPELLTSFQEVFVLTYLFDGQSLYRMLRIYGIPFSYIGIQKRDDGTYCFSDTEHYVPEYVRNLPNMVKIIDNAKMNRIGENDFSLSMNWFNKPQSNVKQLKDNIYNFFNHLVDSDSDERMWGTYESARNKLKGKGYTKGFVPFNKKAENQYRNRTVCAYCVNLYMNVGHKRYYQLNGIEVDEDRYALSIMVQWIWRSAIRDGKTIVLYLPSKRMRKLLIDWMDAVSSSNGDSVNKI